MKTKRHEKTNIENYEIRESYVAQIDCRKRHR